MPETIKRPTELQRIPEWLAERLKTIGEKVPKPIKYDWKLTFSVETTEVTAEGSPVYFWGELIRIGPTGQQGEPARLVEIYGPMWPGELQEGPQNRVLTTAMTNSEGWFWGSVVVRMTGNFWAQISLGPTMVVSDRIKITVRQ